jgi:hypothetical protein
MRVKALLGGALFLFLGQPAESANLLSNVRWGVDVEEQLDLSTSKGSRCESLVKKSLSDHGFVVDKISYNDQDILIFSTAKSGKHKSITRCMGEYNLLITVVIGSGGNLSQAQSINEGVKSLLIAKKSNAYRKLDAETDEISDEIPEKKWLVQVGAFKLAASAEKLFNKLKANGFSAEITKTNTWWKVVLSPSPMGLKEAKNQRLKLKNALNMTANIEAIQ